MIHEAVVAEPQPQRAFRRAWAASAKAGGTAVPAVPKLLSEKI